MAVLKPRSRLVYFRVSEEEFHEYSEMSQHANARSLSDFARSAMQHMRDRKEEEKALADQLKSVDEIIRKVNEKLEVITQYIQATGGNIPESQESGD